MTQQTTQVSHAKKPTTHSSWITIICCSALLLPGCGIPALRHALPGPMMPQYYSIAQNQESGNWIDESNQSNRRRREPAEEIMAPEESVDDSADSPTNSETLPGPIELMSLTIPTEVEEAGSDESTTRPIEVASSAAGPMPPAVPVCPDAVVLDNASQIPLSAFFADPYLIDLINQVLAGNQELRILAEEINIAQNETYARSGEYLPFVDFGARAELEKSSRFTREGAVEEELEAAPGQGFPDPLPDFLVAANVSWELDIWKKLRNAQDAAARRFLGTQEGRNYIVTRIVAEVAENYYELLALDNRMMTLQRTIEIQQQSLQVAENKKAAGRGTELAVQRFQAEVSKNQSEILILQQEIVEAENRINFLLGRYPQPVDRMPVNYIDLNLTPLTTGLPSDLLRNRADIRQAELEVQAAGLDVRVARARFYPSFGLNAGVGLQAFNTRYLLSTPESLIYSVALDLVGPLINKRAIRADYLSANAAQLQSIYNYQQTVLMAYLEVVNQMTKVENYRQSIEVKKQQVQALEASVDAASKLFQNARAEYVEVLLAQRELMEAKMVLIETKQQQLSAIVKTYQALGGGSVLTNSPR